MMRQQIRRARNRFVGITIFTAIFSFIYEYFSHGVYSGFMLWAALIPFVCVVLPYTIWLRRQGHGAVQSTEMQERQEQSLDRSGAEMTDVGRSIYQTAILTFLTGSIFRGILEIYGTTNRLSKVYWIAGGILLLISLGMLVKRSLSPKEIQ